MASAGRSPLPANGGKLARAETGTGRANKRCSKSETTLDDKPTFSTWGGARNRADRVSDHLSLKQARAIIAAAHRAVAIGLPLNRHITIHWERAGIDDGRAAAAIGGFLKLAADWLRTRNARLAYAWARENDAGGGEKGSHVHILAHVAPEQAAGFTAMQRRWLRRVTGLRYRAGTIRTARIGGSLRSATTNPEQYQANLAAIVGYVIKGAAPAAASALGLTRIEPSGRIAGKRASCSQNLGPI